MWVLFPIDSLMGAGRHIVEREHAKYGVLDIEAFMKDEEAMQKISEVLQQTKRKWKEFEKNIQNNNNNFYVFKLKVKIGLLIFWFFLY